jgi:hypothetical protein
MYVSASAFLGLAALATEVAAHGRITKPNARLPGDATAAVCGKNMVQFYKSDETSYPEALKRTSGWNTGLDPTKCDLYFCKGFQFADNKDNVYAYKPGDVVNINVQIRIPHAGYANVSVVDTATNTVIGQPLFTWAKGYADSKDFPNNVPKNQTDFDITIPELGGKCTAAGQCVRGPPPPREGDLRLGIR